MLFYDINKHIENNFKHYTKSIAIRLMTSG